MILEVPVETETIPFSTLFSDLLLHLPSLYDLFSAERGMIPVMSVCKYAKPANEDMSNGKGISAMVQYMKQS